jgi:hypothetical protein
MKKLSIKQFSEKSGLSEDAVTRLVKKKIIVGKKINPLARTSKIEIPESELKKLEKAREQA